MFTFLKTRVRSQAITFITVIGGALLLSPAGMAQTFQQQQGQQQQPRQQQQMQQQPQMGQSSADDFSDQELEAFVQVNEKLVPIQEKINQKKVKTLEEEGLSVEKFNEIHTDQQNPAANEVDASESEISSYNSAVSEIKKINQQAEQEMVEIIQEEPGIDVQRFQQIMVAYQRSPELQKRIQNIVQNG